MRGSLTTTSYAILGFLAMRQWTSYELTQQMKFTLGLCWPRAVSKLYEEPKKLVSCGFATAVGDQVGRRPRTTYTITDLGRAELRAWLNGSAAGPVLEFEQLLKVFLGPYGSKRALLTTLGGVQRWAEDRQADDAANAQRYLEGVGRFPERLPINTLVGAFYSDFALMTRRWARWGQETVRAWPEDLNTAPTDLPTLLRIAAGRVASRPTRG